MAPFKIWVGPIVHCRERRDAPSCNKLCCSHLLEKTGIERSPLSFWPNMLSTAVARDNKERPITSVNRQKHSSIPYSLDHKKLVCM